MRLTIVCPASLDMVVSMAVALWCQHTTVVGGGSGRSGGG